MNEEGKDAPTSAFATVEMKDTNNNQLYNDGGDIEWGQGGETVEQKGEVKVK